MNDTKRNESAEPTKDEEAAEYAHSSDGAAEGDTKDQSPPPQGISSELPATG